MLATVLRMLLCCAGCAVLDAGYDVLCVLDVSDV